MSSIDDNLGNRAGDRAYSCDGSHKRILLVEDDTILMELMTCICNTRGYQVRPARDGREALDIYINERESLRGIMTDCEMPRMNGIELMRNIVQSGNGVPVILTTGRSFEEEEWRSEGFKAYLMKPFTFSEFAACLNRYFPQ